MKFHYIIVLFLIFNPKTLADEFDFSFLNGTNQENAYLIENLSKNIIPGSYVLDVNLNNKYIGRRKITIDENDKDDICFEDDWLQSINFEINDVFYRGVLNIDDYCFYLNKELNTTVDFDYTTQSINFIIPQLGFGKEDKEQSSWDNGVGALRLNYNVNAFASETSTDIYSILDLKGNISDWVLSGSASLSNGDFYPSIGSAARPIKSLESDLIVGKMFTNSDILNGFGLTGLGLRKNTAQSGFDYGYKPIFSGTANSQALVSIIQNGVLIHSEVVSPGPFEIKNVSLLSSGDVSLVVKEKDGKETTRNIPLTISATMINPGDYDFDLYSGVRDEGDGQGLEGVFLSGSYGYGFEGLTLKGSTILHRNYFGLGFGFYKQLGHFGNIDIESSYSYSNNSLNKSEEGTSLSLTYEKAFNAHRRFVFSSDHYLSDRYIDFSSFSYLENNTLNSSLNRSKNQYRFNLSDKVTDSVYASLTYNYTDYWNSSDYNSSLGVSLGTSYKSVNINFNVNANKSMFIDDITSSISFSLPLGKSSNVYTSFSASEDDDYFNYSTGFSSYINKDLSYSASLSGKSDNSDNYASLEANYDHELFNLSGHISSNEDNNTGSASISGSAIFVPSKGDFILSRHVNGTIAIASVNDIPGVKLSRINAMTNSDGKAIIPMSSYRLNRLDIDTSTLPLDIEVINSSQEVIPKDDAVVYIEFDYFKVRRYIFQILKEDGDYVSSGSWAVSKDEKPLGFVSAHGVLLINTSEKLDEFFINDCHITSDIIKHSEKIQKVVCNE